MVVWPTLSKKNHMLLQSTIDIPALRSLDNSTHPLWKFGFLARTLWQNPYQAINQDNVFFGQI